ncbi:MAG: hypothetical protein L0Y36_05915 [Planctomycetales bacterium]|nr:hypothetical protein [Planctomycetales bacterium]
MKKMLKNPTLYYIAAPAAAALWVLLAGFVFYPKSVEACQDAQTELRKTEELIRKMVALKPKLLEKIDKSGKAEVFDFTKTINESAQLFSISPSNYTSNVRGQVNRAGRPSRSAAVTIKSIDIERLAAFLSSLLVRWSDLKCESLSLDKGKAGKNDWKAEMTLTYYYQ